MKYKLIAIDVDGTLVAPDGRVPADTVAALKEAQAAGLRVCLATGRSYVETAPVWRQLALQPPFEPMVLIGGALVSEPDTGRTLWQRALPHELARELADALLAEGCSAMAIVDVWRHGVDYIFARGPRADEEAAQWFGRMNVRVRHVSRLDGNGEMPEVLRISTVMSPHQAPPLAQRLRERFAGRANIHAILAPNYGVTIVEAFAPECDKMRGISYVAQALRVGPGAIVAVGDDVNDLAMIRGAGLGAAMAKAPAEVRQAARCVVEGDLAAFIRRVVAGEFD
jgi:Cof subfamily protein (haloacid dehalogenase superfamily)